jgi:seryl-tRNA(Sec) selenium transferase
LPDVLDLAHDRGLPVLVDAAFDVFPTANMRRYAALGADLFCFSTKYFGGPNSVGFLCGRKDLIDAVAMQGSVGYESRPYRSFFRSFKLDRQLIVAAIVALQEWLETDHDARWRAYREQIETVERYLEDLPGLTLTPMYFTMDDTLEPSPINCLRIGLAAGGKSPREVAAELRTASPAVVLHAYDDALVVVADALRAGDDEIVGARLRAALG